jgi:hypothetical protein
MFSERLTSAIRCRKSSVMRVLTTLACFAFLLAASAAQAAQRNQAAPKTPALVVACTGPFAKSMTHASLVKAFGRGNVAIEQVGIGEGETVTASVIFPRDAARRIEVLWIDEKRRRNPSEIRTGVESAWRTAQGLRRGMTLEQVGALNGRPFKLYGFGFDYGGTTLDWNGGALATPAGGCTPSLRFMMREGADNAGVHVGEQDFMSDDAAMRRAAPVVDAVGLRFGE